MTKRSRTYLFFILITVFILVVPVIIFYPQGYRFDIKTQRITQVGAFYFEVQPPRAQIYVDQERIGETSRFAGNNLSKNFLPQDYFIEIKKEGYVTWQKSLEIQPRQVTEAKHITLFLRDINLVSIQSNVLNFWVAPNDRDILLQKTASNNLWKLVLWNTETNNEYTLFQSNSPKERVHTVQWAPNSNAYLLRIASGDITQTSLQKLDRSILQSADSSTSTIAIAHGLFIPLPSLQDKIRDIRFSPFNDGQLVYVLENALSILDYESFDAPKPLAQNVYSFGIEGDSLYWMDEKGIIWVKQSSNDATIQVSQEQLTVTTQKIYLLHIYDKNIFLETPDTLYWLNQETKVFDKLSMAPTTIAASPDGKKLAISDGSEIHLLFLEKQEEKPVRQKGEKILLTRLSEQITSMDWFNAYNLIYTAGNKILVSEIDTRNHMNIVELAIAPSPRFFWQEPSSILYVYSNNQIQYSAKLK
jgi:WD40 repeat protein